MIYTYTGNPFVDAGISALVVWADKRNAEEIDIQDLKRIIPKVVDLYVTEGWRKVLFSVFPNNPVTNPSVKEKKVKLSELYEKLCDSIEPLGKEGTCIACGRRKADKLLTKTDVPLTGSGSLKNFFSYGTEGADYCSACTLAIQFSPLVLYSCRKLILLHSNSPKIMRRWARECKKQVSKKGCFNEDYTNPRNSLFHIAEKLVEDNEEKIDQENIFIRIYYFTNYNQGPELDIYDFPENVFRFINLVKRSSLYHEWRKVVQRGYRVSKNVQLDDYNESEYKNYNNYVYDKLLAGESVTSYFLNSNDKAAIGNWRLLELYMKEVRGLERERLELIRRIGDEIADAIYEKDAIKRINSIESAQTYYDFLKTLLLITKDRLALGKDEPLVTFDEIEEKLFPEGRMDWREVQYLILFRVYERLHDWIVSKKSPGEIENDILELEKVEGDD